MKWELANISPLQEIYRLTNNDKKLLTLNFHQATNSARLEYAKEKRVLLIRKEGFLRSKSVLRNEYGVRLGQLSHEKTNSSEGTIEVGEEKFLYTIKDNSRTELVIYRDNIEHPFVICDLKVDNADSDFQPKKPIQLSASQHFLVMALCWYMTLPVAKENMLEYAV